MLCIITHLFPSLTLKSTLEALEPQLFQSAQSQKLWKYYWWQHLHHTWTWLSDKSDHKDYIWNTLGTPSWPHPSAEARWFSPRGNLSWSCSRASWCQALWTDNSKQDVLTENDAVKKTTHHKKMTHSFLGISFGWLEEYYWSRFSKYQGLAKESLRHFQYQHGCG